MYNHECEMYKKINPDISITKYATAKLTAKPYVKAFSPENLSSAFKKAGIYPFIRAVITPEQGAETVEQEQATQSDADSDSTINNSTIADDQPIIPDLQPCKQRNISNAPVQKISENLA